MKPVRSIGGIVTAGALAGCSPMQSALHPTGLDADRINTLFWVMTVGGGLILLLVCVLTGLALFGGPALRARLAREKLVTSLGIAFPVVVLSVLLTYGFLVLRAGAETVPDEGGVRIAITGEMWWWRVTYTDPDGNSFQSANELHLPVGEPVTLELTTADVIHSFWAPTLAGKLDMIPGRTNTMTVVAQEAGITRGQCAEYCGGAHAFMAFHVVAQPSEDFAAWLAAEAAPAAEPAAGNIARGQQLFLTSGCGGCHAIRGTEADGVIGPDLTHLGSRHSLAAATLPNTAEAIAAFIVNNQHIKPENRMPAYGIFTEAELADLTAYLGSLR